MIRRRKRPTPSPTSENNAKNYERIMMREQKLRDNRNQLAFINTRLKELDKKAAASRRAKNAAMQALQEVSDGMIRSAVATLRFKLAQTQLGGGGSLPYQ